MANYDAIVYAEDDGLKIPEIGPWGIKKYNLVGHYCNIFTSAMRKKYDKLVYLDLFAGAGYAKVREVERIVHTSTLVAMNTPNQFDHYILSEYFEENCNALRSRIDRHFPGINYSLYQGDTNLNVDHICDQLQRITSRHNTLCFCFVDPFSLNLHFDTIRKLSQFRIDFFILLAVQMAFRRNLDLYLNPKNTTVEKFLNNKNWRSDLAKSPDKQEIIRFLAMQYDQNMLSLGYKTDVQKELFRTNIGNMPLYYLAFYSRHSLGNDFFKKISHKGDNHQFKLF